MVVSTQLDPPCKLAQSFESDTGEQQELMLHVGHVLKWCLFFDGLPLLLALPQVVKEPGLQLIPLRLHAGGVVVPVEGPENLAQFLLPPLAPIVLQRMFSRGSVEAPLALEVEDGGGLRGAPVGHPPYWQGIGILVFLMEDLSRPPLGWLAG